MRSRSRRRISFFSSAIASAKSIWHHLFHPEHRLASIGVRNAPFRLAL
jgi:hypothetical protein